MHQPIFEILPATKALPRWERLREDFRRGGGVWPFIVGDRTDTELFLELADFSADSQAESLALASSLDADGWWAEAAGLWADDYPAIRADAAIDEPLPADYAMTEPLAGIVSLTDFQTGRLKRNVRLGRLALEAPWEIFAATGWGGWNDCPVPAVHTALHRAWEARFGAEVVVLGPQVIECRVARPPETFEEALTLARQQFPYCPGLLEGLFGLEDLALRLLNGSYWYFWWS